MIDFILKLFDKLWVLLPDKCEMPDCCRKGIRGNENRIEGKIVCDYCHSKMMENDFLRKEKLK